MRYRLYQPEDFPRLYAIEEACFQPPLRFSRGHIRRLVRSGQAATWIAESEGQLAGFAIAEWQHGGSGAVAYIETIEVAPDRRGQGIGGELLRRVEASARTAGARAIWLHVDASNEPAIHLYEASGYLCRGRKEDYYAGGRPALVYAKPLAREAAP